MTATDRRRRFLATATRRRRNTVGDYTRLKTRGMRRMG